MNYYEELGISPGATLEEIRLAYKTLARLLHPDGQADERLKAMAECQMRRLNEVLATLADPEKRRAYDARVGLAAPVVVQEAERYPRPQDVASWMRGETEPQREPGKIHAWAQAASRHWFWILIGATVVGTAILWMATGGERQAELAAPGIGAAASAESAKEPKENGKAKQEKAEAESSAKKAKKDSAGAAALPEPPSVEPGDPTRVTLPPGLEKEPEAPKPERAAGGSAAKPEVAEFGGSWLYTPAVDGEADAGGYHATYVELVVAENSGEIAGTYRARYQVPDKAISPEVELRVRGKRPGGKAARLEWTAGDGGKGVMELTLRQPGLMAVRWWATELGSRAGLSSGSAELVRQEGQ